MHRLRVAIQSGELKAILWHQGGADSLPGLSNLYAARLHDLIRRFRDLAGDDQLPFIVGQLGQFKEWSDARQLVNAVHENIATQIERTRFVSSDGLNHVGDKSHFDAASARELGRRYAQAYADILQIGARNMQNYSLLEAVGKTTKPILLKTGMMSTVEELLMAAEYILSNGNPNVILCERGIRSFEKYTRNTLDISAVPMVKSLSHLPIIVDPSHATGLRHLVAPVSKSAIAAGADGLIIEVHPHPEKALSDGAQSLHLEEFEKLMAELAQIAEAVGRRI